MLQINTSNLCPGGNWFRYGDGISCPFDANARKYL